MISAIAIILAALITGTASIAIALIDNPAPRVYNPLFKFRSDSAESLLAPLQMDSKSHWAAPAGRATKESHERPFVAECVGDANRTGLGHCGDGVGGG